MGRAEFTTNADVVIVGFGFSGLATLTNLVRTRGAREIAIVAPDRSGHGIAYATDRPVHLLNVVARRMGAWADDEGHFADWLCTADAARACDALGVTPPGPNDFAPRALFASYLDALRDAALAQLAADGGRVQWIAGTARSVDRADRGWIVRTGEAAVRARTCVLACGNDTRHFFGALRHPRLHDGPWSLGASDVPAGGGPAVLIGSGLTAVDALLSLRAVGHRDQVIALSRHGWLPRAHDHALRPLEVRDDELDGVRTLADVVRLMSRWRAAGGDWRVAVDAMRPHTARTWQRLPDADQREVVERWGSIWNVHRHRMAPAVAARVKDELAAGGLRVRATQRIEAIADGDVLAVEFTSPEGLVDRIQATMVIDCTGPQLDPARSEQPLLRGLVERGIARRHQTGLGFHADADQQVAPGLYAIGSLLTGQLWETVAVPELRGQAARVAGAIAGASASVRSGRAA